jgi:hypothetical protein
MSSQPESVSEPPTAEPASEHPTAEAGESRALSAEQAHEAAYRLIALYYDYERTVPIRQLLEAISRGHSASDDRAWAVGAVWQACVQETLDGAPLPDLPPPWDS